MKTWQRIVSAVLGVVGFVLKPITNCIFALIYERHARKVPPITDSILLQSGTSLAKKIRKREVTSEQVVETFINRIKVINPIVNAVVSERFEDALAEAREIDSIIGAGKLDERYSEVNAPFLGVPFTTKEAFAVKGLSNSSGLKSRSTIIADVDAPVIKNVRKAGGIPLCVTNVSELCMWWESANTVYGRTGNPYNNSRIVGGSSGGEACTLSAAGSVIGVGSDIGGSIRLPSMFCGIFGHKPTFGIVNNDGQYPNATAKEKDYLVTGPMCRYACDLKPMLKILAGDKGAKLKLDQEEDIRKLRYFTMEDDGGDMLVNSVDSEIRATQRELVKKLTESLGVTVQPVQLSKLKYSLEMWEAKMSTCGGTTFCELMGNGVPVNPYLEFIKWLVGLSNHTLPAISLGMTEKLGRLFPEKQKKAISICEKLKEEFQELLGDNGVLIYPTQPRVAPYHNQPLLMPFNFAYTGVFNVLGLPVTQCPVGLNSEGLPMGIQLVGSLYSDRLTIAVAQEVEKLMGGWQPQIRG
ncbi:fatty-acid amide hydrolase 2 [Lingula anatina]|uniref:Fatty-acid amide hydrolase 2 n=1 Tax=Lingula anatina TaxID=7574 RepID=A0A1S3INN3_LINAN|nr:fatty-acid amide hydrolase 2 [Lingula anatina]|eukprot:XP_013399812.1 fatty-acid amide hydrolase 2 [Lingula anatina]